MNRYQSIVVLACFGLLQGCATGLVADSAGIRGQVLDSISGKSILGAEVCLTTPIGRCVVSNDQGRFSLQPLTHEVREFFMMEYFPYEMLGEFRVMAPGYQIQQLKTSYAEDTIVVLKPTGDDAQPGSLPDSAPAALRRRPSR